MYVNANTSQQIWIAAPHAYDRRPHAHCGHMILASAKSHL